MARNFTPIIFLILGLLLAPFTRAENSVDADFLTSSPQAWQLEVLKEINALYAPYALAQGKLFLTHIQITSPSESAEADFDGKTMKLIINGGLLNNKVLTPDGFRVILCHEMGHILGGAPRRDVPMEWAGPAATDGKSLLSSEGQADYYATSVCFRQLVKNDLALFPRTLATVPIPRRVQKLCQQSYGPDTQTTRICVRGALGGENMLQIVRRFPISFAIPDRTHATETITNSYPSRQCRLDTLFAGALCRKALPLELDLFQAEKNGCTEKINVRPPCWYTKPRA